MEGSEGRNQEEGSGSRSPWCSAWAATLCVVGVHGQPFLELSHMHACTDGAWWIGGWQRGEGKMRVSQFKAATC